MMKDLLKQMFQGWILHEAAYDQETRSYARTAEECMTEACGGDELRGNMLCLFGHWSNDVVSLAAHYGVGLARKQPSGDFVYPDGTVDTLLLGGELTITEVPTATSPEHYWHAGAWQQAERNDADETAAS